VLRDLALTHGFREGYEDGVLRCASVTRIKLTLPLIKEFEGGGGVSDFVAEIVRDAAVGVDVEEMLAQAAGQEPTSDGEIFIMRAREAGTVFTRLNERGGRGGDSVFGR
jgi:hypothetical protein